MNETWGEDYITVPNNKEATYMSISYHELESHLLDNWSRRDKLPQPVVGLADNGLKVKYVEHNLLEGGILVALSFRGVTAVAEFDTNELEDEAETEQLFLWLDQEARKLS